MCELRLVELGIEAALGDQVVVRATFDDPAGCHHEDLVRLAHGGQAMRDHDRSSSGQDYLEGLLQSPLGLRVEVGRGLVENHDIGGLEQQGDRDALLLTA